MEEKKNFTKRLLEFVRELGTFSGYKIITCKSIAFVYTNIVMAEKELDF